MFHPIVLLPNRGLVCVRALRYDALLRPSIPDDAIKRWKRQFHAFTAPHEQA